MPVASEQDPHMLDPLKVMVCRGTLGVAENGAVWLRESDLGNRAAPFITEHLILVLDKSRLVPDLFAAYEQLHVDGEGFGLFVAGPSKTADIEQSLVLGAHGPKRHTVILLDDKDARTDVHTSKDA
jgi:L-lactate dehydrogenase complex protein LldG